KERPLGEAPPKKGPRKPLLVRGDGFASIEEAAPGSALSASVKVRLWGGKKATEFVSEDIASAKGSCQNSNRPQRGHGKHEWLLPLALLRGDRLRSEEARRDSEKWEA